MVGIDVSTPLRASLLKGLSMTAPATIVTIYGDIVVPRGGSLWMGSLIEICAPFGITETQVRTAVSRLVNAGQLTGIRDGRRSYYSLAEGARGEFARAERLLFEPIPPSEGWTILLARDLSSDVIRRHNLGTIGTGLYLRPKHDHVMPVPPGIEWNATLTKGGDDLSAMVAALWPIDARAEDYRAFITRFSGLAEHCAGGGTLSGPDAVLARLLLVHLYRRIRLADPILPAETLPADWPGSKASNLFARLYLALSPWSDACIGEILQGRDGALPEATTATARRLTGLQALDATIWNP